MSEAFEVLELEELPLCERPRSESLEARAGLVFGRLRGTSSVVVAAVFCFAFLFVFVAFVFVLGGGEGGGTHFCI